MDRFLVNPRPKPQPKPKPTNLMEVVISIKHDEGVVENPCLHTVAWEWAARLGVSQMAASQMIVAFLQLPPRPYKPLPERVACAEVILISDPMQAWFESRDVFACSRAVAEKRRYRWPNFEGVSLDLSGRTATQLVSEYVRLLRPYWRRQVWRVLGGCTHWTKSYQQKWDIINSVFQNHALESARKARPTKGDWSGDDLFSGRVVQTSHHELGSATTSHQTSSRGRGQGEDLGGRLRNRSFDTPPPPLRDAQPPERRAHESRPVLLPADRPAAPQPAVRPEPTPHS